jgi:localization factor PodJL
MARKGKAKAGSSRTGRLVLNPSRRNEDGKAARASAIEDTAALNVGVAPVKILGEGQTPGDTEKRLYAYLDQMKSPQPAVFPPFGELHARLPELEKTPDGASPIDARDEARGPRAAAGGPSHGNSDWLDQKFSELTNLVSAKDRDRDGIADIHAKLAEIITRIDRLSAQMPGVRAIEAVETKLDDLFRSLDESRDQSSAEADRISAAARGIIAAATRVQEAREGFEAIARDTADALEQTVAVTASRAAVLAASQVATALQPSSETGGNRLLEAELRALSQQTRETGERTEAALERLHTTLREFLKHSASDRAQVPLPGAPKQPRLHLPISSPNSAAYTRAHAGFGAAPADTPRLDVFTNRDRRGLDPNSIMEFEVGTSAAGDYTREHPLETNAGPHNPPQGSLKMPPSGDEDKGLPLLGISIVAIILLMAAAALYYLQTARNIQPSGSSIEQEAHAQVSSHAEGGISIYAPFPLRAAQAVSLRDEVAGLPVLLSSASDNRAGAEVQPERAAEDLKDLEAAASHGDSEAQFRIGTRFLSDGAFSNGGAARAARWLKKAADRGHLEAQFMLASLYERGAGVPKDESEAMSLYHKAATAGHIRAMHNLGVLLSARESPQDYSEAAVWFARAAQAGLTDSQYNLALLYERGLGVDQDLSRAYLWYRAAGRGGDKEAARQAERLKRALPAGMSGTQASSWRPTLEERSKAPDSSNRRG